ncbi:MAG: type 4a pilus biogenesis protein PilO [Candidatus Omnitrophica bacterium]|nr:type 4a pilus biogenesis protein PilO [Candidatus Omnitrophota bacterium]
MKPPGRAAPFAGLTRLQPAQQRWLVTTVVLLAGLAIAHQGIVQPLRRRRAELDARFALAQQQIALLRALETTHQELRQSRQRLRGRGDSASLLQDISTLAATHNISVNTAAPQPSQPAGRYTRLPIRMDVTGTYATLLQFLYALETAPQPLLVEQVDLAASATSDWSGATPRPLDAHLIVSALLTESPA